MKVVKICFCHFSQINSSRTVGKEGVNLQRLRTRFNVIRKLRNEEKSLYGLSELVDFTSEVHRMRHILATAGILSYTLWIETN